MKRILIAMVALLAMVAFVGGAIAQGPAKTEKPAAAPEKAAPAAEKPKAEKAKADKPKALKATGTVIGYEAGKVIKIKGAKDKESTFDLSADAKIKGDVKEGAKVTVMYKKDGDKMIATSVSVAPPPKKKEAPKKEEKKG